MLPSRMTFQCIFATQPNLQGEIVWLRDQYFTFLSKHTRSFGKTEFQINFTYNISLCLCFSCTLLSRTNTVSQEWSQPMISCNRDLFPQILPSQPYMQGNDNVLIICLGLWGFLNPNLGSKFPNHKIVKWNLI